MSTSASSGGGDAAFFTTTAGAVQHDISSQGQPAELLSKAERIVFMRFDSSGRLKWTRAPDRLKHDFGRLRSVTRAPNGDLLVTTDNGSGNDAVVRVSPRR